MENKICSARSAIGNRISADHETAPKGTDKWKKKSIGLLFETNWSNTTD